MMLLIYGLIGLVTFLLWKILFSNGGKINFKHTYTPSTKEQLAEYKTGKYYVTNPYDKRPIQLSKTGLASIKPVTVFDIFNKNLETGADKILLEQEVYSKITDSWSWRRFTRQQFFDLSRQAARSIISLGLNQWESVAIMGFNSPEWFISDIGTIYAGGLVAGIYTTNNSGQCKYIVDHCKARIVIVENTKHLKKFLAIKNELKNVNAIVVWADDVPNDYDNKNERIKIYNWEQFMDLGNNPDTIDELNKKIDERISNISPEQCMTLIYTSGTTGPPKAVMISHDNIVWECKALIGTLKDIDLTLGSHKMVSYLPLSHIAAQIADLHWPLTINSQGGNFIIVCARPTALKGTLMDTVKYAKPTVFFGVPRVWEKIEEKMKLIASKQPKSFIKSKLVNWAKNVGKTLMYARQINGDKIKPNFTSIAQKLVFNKVRQALGFQNLRLAITGAAPVKRSTLEFFGCIGINIVEVYGMSETCGVHHWGRNFYNTIGSVGPTLQGVETFIDTNASTSQYNIKDSSRQEGEILMRGRQIMMGYMYNEEKCKKTIDENGFVRSGDVGYIDRNHCLYITGRIKELIITAGGENIAPVPMESYIKTIRPAISNFIVIGDKKKFLSALVTLRLEQNPDTLEFSSKLTGLSKTVNTSISDISEAIKNDDWRKYIQTGIDQYNSNPEICVSRACKIQKFTILNSDFSVPGGELTSTLKLKRKIIHERYHDQIEAMYA